MERSSSRTRVDSALLFADKIHYVKSSVMSCIIRELDTAPVPGVTSTAEWLPYLQIQAVECLGRRPPRRNAAVRAADSLDQPDMLYQRSCAISRRLCEPFAYNANAGRRLCRGP